MPGADHLRLVHLLATPCSVLCSTSPWCSGKCVRFGAGRSRGRLLAGSYQDLVNWYCSLLTRRTVYGRAAELPYTIRCTEELQGTQSEHKTNQPSENEPRNCTISVLALQDHCSYKAPTTNHHIKQTSKWAFGSQIASEDLWSLISIRLLT